MEISLRNVKNFKAAYLKLGDDMQPSATSPDVLPDVPVSGSGGDGDVSVEQPMDGTQTEAVAANKRIVGYFESWGIYGRDFQVSDINAEKLTHINYSFFDVKGNGNVAMVDSWADLEKRYTNPAADELVSRNFSPVEWSALDKSRRQSYGSGVDFSVVKNVDGSRLVTALPDSWNEEKGYYGNLNQMRLLKQLYPDVEIGFALGGWTLSDEFSDAVDVTNRANLVDSIVQKVADYEFFSVVDFDWEYPGGGGLDGNAVSDKDGENFALMLKDLRQGLDQLEADTGRQVEISVATAGGAEKLSNLNLEGIDPYVNFYNVMTYDFHGGWEPTTGHQAPMTGDQKGYDVLNAIEQFKSAGISSDKVVLGAPAYTRAWGDVAAGNSFGYAQSGDSRQAPGSFEAGTYDYKDMLTGVNQGAYDLIWDDTSKAAFVYNSSERIWSSMETTATIAGKAAYVQEAELGGMMFWALSSDTLDEQSLITTAYDVLNSGKSAASEINGSASFDQIIGGDGQFSVGDFTQLA